MVFDCCCPTGFLSGLCVCVCGGGGVYVGVCVCYSEELDCNEDKVLLLSASSSERPLPSNYMNCIWKTGSGQGGDGGVSQITDKRRVGRLWPPCNTSPRQQRKGVQTAFEAHVRSNDQKDVYESVCMLEASARMFSCIIGVREDTKHEASLVPKLF